MPAIRSVCKSSITQFVGGSLPSYGRDRVRLEVWELYWKSDISTPEIIRAYDLQNVIDLRRIAGPASLAGVSCRRCERLVWVFSRSELSTRVQRLEAPPQFLADWAYPDVCRPCSNEIRERREEEFRRSGERRAARGAELRSMPYREYLQTPEWKERRIEALRRAGRRCQVCSASGGLDVHHRSYERRGAERASDLTVLCRPCHSLFHKSSELQP